MQVWAHSQNVYWGSGSVLGLLITNLGAVMGVISVKLIISSVLFVEKKASFSRSMLCFSSLAIKTTLWRVCTLRQRRYVSGQSHLDIKQQISRHLYLRRNTSFSVHLWNRVLFGAAVMYKQGWRYVGCRPSLLFSPLLCSQFVSAILLFTTGHWRLLCN